MNAAPELDKKELADALEHEAFVRAAAFLAVPEMIAGYAVMPMTVEQYTVLGIMRHPLIYGGTPSPKELFQFLWLLSPEYRPNNRRGERRFLKRCKEFSPTAPPRFGKRLWAGQEAKRLLRFRDIVTATHKYVFETMADRPANKPKDRETKADAFSDACWFCSVLGRAYGYPRDFVMRMPLKQVFQFINAEILFHDPTAVTRSVANDLRGKWLDQLNEEAKKNPIKPPMPAAAGIPRQPRPGNPVNSATPATGQAAPNRGIIVTKVAGSGAA